MTRTSIYVRSFLVCFKCFLLIGVCYISYRGFQTKVYKLVAVIVYARLKKKKKEKKKKKMKSVSLGKLSEEYTSEVLVYLFMLRQWAHNSTYTDAATLATVHTLMLWLQVLWI